MEQSKEEREGNDVTDHLIADFLVWADDLSGEIITHHFLQADAGIDVSSEFLICSDR